MSLHSIKSSRISSLQDSVEGVDYISKILKMDRPTFLKSLKYEDYKLDEVKFVYSEKATKCCEISTLLLSTVHTDKSKVEILQKILAFSKYMNFTNFSNVKNFEGQFS